MRTHTYQYTLATPVPDSTPPEQRPNTEVRLGDWDHLETRAHERTAVRAIAPLGATLAALELTRQEQPCD